MKSLSVDVIIIGSGLAGLSTALRLSPHFKVALLCKGSLWDSASAKAQGGIAAVKDKTDSLAAHINDTLIAGAGLCDEKAVEYIVKQAPAALDWLISFGIPFKRQSSGQLHLHQEGGHSHRRIAHVADKSGHEIINCLIKTVQQRANIQIFEQVFCQDLLIDDKDAQCSGVRLINKEDLTVFDIFAQNTVLASGGIGQLFARTTNPHGATADGLALAWRAGCSLANMEFVQFHPTALALVGAPAFLISEALRGEGALLKRRDGSRFMPDYDSRAELAPRDIVARAINSEILKHNGQAVFLDISQQSLAFITKNFPEIYAICRSYGLDISQEPIPIAPAEHYSCGGVHSNLKGQTSIAHLYAVGEVAYTGLHGANRLASNSLLECVVIAHAIAEGINNNAVWSYQDDNKQLIAKVLPAVDTTTAKISLAQLQNIMQRHLGIVRSNLSLKTAHDFIKQQHNDDSNLTIVGKEELQNMLTVASVIIQSAALRSESRGLHFNQDYPHTTENAKISLVKKGD